MAERERRRHGAQAAENEMPTTGAQLKLVVTPDGGESASEGDAAYNDELRESLGRGSPSVLFGTSARSLARGLAKLKASQRR